MTQIFFQNDLGTLRMSGGLNDIWRLTNVSGLAASGKSYQTAIYAMTAGQKTTAVHRSARIITIAGDIAGGAMVVPTQIARAVRILDRPGWLLVCSMGRKRRIWARCTSFEPGKRQGLSFREFQMQFCCDCPFFESVEETTAMLFERELRLKTQFTLPTVFSKRVSKGTVLNGGDVEAEPVFEIHFGADGEFGEGAVELMNYSTAQKISFSLSPSPNESVTVDIANRKIFNNLGENLLFSLSDDSCLSSFGLAAGANLIEVVSEFAADFSVVCRFTNRYLEAVC